MTTKNIHIRPATRIEEQVISQLAKEFDGKLPSYQRSYNKVSGNDLRRAIRIAVCGVSFYKTNHKAMYQKWNDEAKEPWMISVSLVSFKTLYQRAEELLQPQMEAIDNARWYFVGMMNGQDRQVGYIQDNTDKEALEHVQWQARWNGMKATILRRATWNTEHRVFVLGERISLKGYSC